MASATAKTRWGDKEARRRDILDAARELLERDGYERLSVRDVAHGAGVSLGTVYNYFASREGLFAALYAERLEQFHAEIAPLCAQAESPEALFVGIADHYLPMYRVFGRDMNLWAVLVAAESYPLEVAEPLLEAAGRVMATIETALDGFAPPGPGPRPDRHLVLPFLWSTLTGLADHFTGMRHLMHAYTWDELTAFTAGTVVAGLTTTTKDHA